MGLDALRGVPRQRPVHLTWCDIRQLCSRGRVRGARYCARASFLGGPGGSSAVAAVGVRDQRPDLLVPDSGDALFQVQHQVLAVPSGPARCGLARRPAGRGVLVPLCKAADARVSTGFPDSARLQRHRELVGVLPGDVASTRPAHDLPRFHDHRLSVNRCTAVPLYRCTAVPLYRCTAVPLYRCTATPGGGTELSAGRAAEWDFRWRPEAHPSPPGRRRWDQ